MASILVYQAEANVTRANGKEFPGQILALRYQMRQLRSRYRQEPV
jgi:hypothetical protein